jgi:nucleoside-diphosphate-sugar epimerase
VKINFTIIGSTGFIGNALAKSLKAKSEIVFTPPRDDETVFSTSLGHVIYAAGVTADFRSRPFDTLRANTTFVAKLLEQASFESLLYLSSARIYRHSAYCREDAEIFLRSHEPEDLYDLTKLTGESLCHATKRDSVRVVRLTNVVGSDFHSQNFLFDLIRSACDSGQIKLRSGLKSAKDYILLEDVIKTLPKIAVSGGHKCYNLGSGYNLTHAELLEPILQATKASLTVEPNAPEIIIPPIDIERISTEFGYQPSPVLPYISELIYEYRKIART